MNLITVLYKYTFIHIISVFFIQKYLILYFYPIILIIDFLFIKITKKISIDIAKRRL